MGPVSASFYVTTICNAKCGFCNIWEGRPSLKPKLVPLDQSTQIIKGLKQLGVRYIDFTGGEPLLARQLPDLLRIAKGMGLRTGVATNGLLYPARSGDLAGLIDSLSFSLDSADRERHNASRGLQCYDRVIEGIDIARGLGHVVNINFSVANDGLDEIPGILALAKELQILVHVMPVFQYFGNPALRSEYISALRALTKEPYMSVNLAALRFHEAGGNDTERPKCRGLGANVAVSQDGYFLAPCYHGTVERVPILPDPVKAWRSPQMVALRKQAGRYDFCKGCTVWCYVSPSFYYTLDSYFALQAYSMGRTALKLAKANRQASRAQPVPQQAG